MGVTRYETIGPEGFEPFDRKRDAEARARELEQEHELDERPAVQAVEFETRFDVVGDQNGFACRRDTRKEAQAEATRLAEQAAGPDYRKPYETFDVVEREVEVTTDEEA